MIRLKMAHHKKLRILTSDSDTHAATLVVSSLYCIVLLGFFGESELYCVSCGHLFLSEPFNELCVYTYDKGKRGYVFKCDIV